MTVPDTNSSSNSSPEPTPVGAALQLWFRRPRAHGELVYDRRVTWLELFYDLVFVVLVAQITHRLSSHITLIGVFDYVVMFLLIWLLWLNGSYYQELHGQNDGRSRLYMFAQMAFLVVLTVYAAHAVDDPSQAIAFGVTYFLLVMLLSFQWWYLRRIDTAEFQRTVAIYVTILFSTGAIIGGAAFIPDNTTRTVVWGVAVVANIVLTPLAQLRAHHQIEGVTEVTESWAERMGLFMIVVLGEVVVGVGDGLANGDPSPTHVITGLLMLFLGFGIWWNYFDFVGRRQPQRGDQRRAVWITAHMVLAGAIAAVGAGMVSMIEHSGDGVVPLAPRSLIAGSLALTLLALAAVVWTLPRRPALGRTVPVLVAGAVYSALLVLVPVAPILYALLLQLPLWVPWVLAFNDAARAGELIIDADEVITPEV